MPNAYFTIAKPANDPFLGYLPGSPERAALKAELDKQAAQVVKIPLIIGGKEVWTDRTIQVTMPHDHHHVIAECCMAGEKELKMAIEQYTESMTLQNMKCVLGENDFGYVFPQGDVADVSKVERLLKKAGGKPKECALSNYSMGGTGKAKPEYIITFKDESRIVAMSFCEPRS